MDDHGSSPYYREDLAYVHDRGYGSHATNCAPGLLALLEPVLDRHGLVVEIGCGSGRLTKHLVDAGHRVLATDASPAMLALARQAVPGAEQFQILTLPDDPIPAAHAVVGVGHALNYLPDLASIHRGLGNIADAIQPDGVLAIDLCDLEWGAARVGTPAHGRAHHDWAIVTEFSQPSPDTFVRDITTFVRNDDGTYRRDAERHTNILVDTSRLPALLRDHGVAATVGTSFDDDHPLPTGLTCIIGRKIGRPGAAP